MERDAIKNIFLDLDGTLVDSSRRSYFLYRTIIRELDGRPLSYRSYLRLKRAKPLLEDVLRKSRGRNDVWFFKKYWETHIESPDYLAHDRLAAGAKSVLARLANTHPLYLITLRRNKLLLHRELVRFGIAHYFHKVVSFPVQGRERAERKTKSLRKLARKGDIIVGDSETDIRAGKALGLITIATTGGWRSRALLRRERPARLLAGIRDLASVVDRIRT